MVSQIDPVTGLPLIGDMSHIDQIPLGVQIVPWNDLKATAKPQRGPIYPDDAWTVYGLVQGQNQDNPDQTQTIYTDGNHNLRVNVENFAQFPSGGGGGGGAAAIPVVTYGDGSGTGYGVRLLHAQTCFIGNNFRNLQYLLGFFVSVDWESANASTVLQAFASVDLYDRFGTFYMALGVVTTGGFTTLPANNIPLHAQDRVNFPGAIDLTQFMATPSDARVQVRNNAWNCYVAGNSYFASAV